MPKPIIQTIARLSPRQQEALGWVCIGQDIGVYPRAAKSLERRGLIVTRHAVPPAVHIAWAAWCSQQPEQQEAP